MRKTKIIATIGPASRDRDTLDRFARAVGKTLKLRVAQRQTVPNRSYSSSPSAPSTSGDLDFHFYSVDGLKLIGWLDDGLSYVIVSDIDAVGGESCVVCHGQGAERRKFEALEPAP